MKQLFVDAGIPAELAELFGATCDDGGFDVATLHSMSLDELSTEVCNGKRGHARRLAAHLSNLKAGGAPPAAATAVLPTATVVAVTAVPITAIPAAEAALLPISCAVALLASGAATAPAEAVAITGEGICAVEQSTLAAAEAVGGLPTLGSATERYGSEFGPRCGKVWHEGIPIMRSWIEVLWQDGKWYRGRVTARDATTGLYHVKYDDGDKKDYDLGERDFRVFMWEDGTMGAEA